MKKIRFLKIWIAVAALCFAAIPLGTMVRNTISNWLRAESVSTSAANDRTTNLIVSQHPDADLCMVHYPKCGAFEINFLGEVDCHFVQDQLRIGNSTHGVAALKRMTFVRDAKMPCMCYGLLKHSSYTVNCDSVSHLIRDEEYCRLKESTE